MIVILSRVLCGEGPKHSPATLVLRASAQVLRIANCALLRMTKLWGKRERFHSVLSAFAGSIEAARRAGTNPARDAATTNVKTDVTRTATLIPFTS